MRSRLGFLWIGLLTFATVGLAEGSGSLDWQRTQLENQLTSRITKAVGASIPEKLFIVNVAIEVKLAAKKEVLASGTSPKDQWTGKELAGKDSERIFIDKLDFDLPVPESGAKENAQIDIFENIANVRATVLADVSLSDSKLDLIKKIATEILKSVSSGEMKPDVRVDKADFAAPPEKWDVKKFLVDVSLPITLILITVFLCLTFMILGLVYFMNYRKIESRKVKILEAQNSREQSAFQLQQEKEAKDATDEASAFAVTADASHGVAHEHAAGGPGHEVEGAESGFNRFKNFLRDNPEKTVSLIRQWVKASDQPGASEALAVLPQILTTTELMEIFNKIEIDERKLWKKLLTKPVNQGGYKLAEGFVSSQIVDSLLGNLASVDESLSARVARLTATECVAIAYESSELGGMLVNLLPSPRLAGFFALMPRELVNDVTMKSVKIQDEEMVALSSKLNAAIEAVQKKTSGLSTNSFLEKAPDLLKELDPEKEKMFLNTLSDSGEYQTLRNSVRKFFPSELIMKLPPKLLKAALDRFPLSKRGDLISSREENERELLLSAIGIQGSKGRDVIDLEILEVNADDLRKKRIEVQKEQLWAEFLASVRAFLVSSPAAAQQAEGLLETWISEKTGGQSNAA